MTETNKRYVTADSYDRGATSYEKTPGRWKDLSITAATMIVVGGSLVTVPLGPWPINKILHNVAVRFLPADRSASRYRHTQLRWQRLCSVGSVVVVGTFLMELLFGRSPVADTLIIVLGFLAIPGVVLTGAGYLLALLARTVIRRRHYDDFIYRLALHFMHEMEIPQPEKVLADTPRYLDAFEETRAAVTTVEAANNGKGVPSQSLTPLSRRIGSLVLRDETSLALTPRLIELISERKLLDYDTLATLLDQMSETHSARTEGIL